MMKKISEQFLKYFSSSLNRFVGSNRRSIGENIVNSKLIVTHCNLTFQKKK